MSFPVAASSVEVMESHQIRKSLTRLGRWRVLPSLRFIQGPSAAHAIHPVAPFIRSYHSAPG
eukprot:scaffold1091_cov164-Ochromonas_danica.AAC.61